MEPTTSLSIWMNEPCGGEEKEKEMSETSKVYFADFRCPSWRENLPQKLARLMMTAGFGNIDMEDKYVAIKMHF